MVAAEAAKAYPPPQITSVIKELGMKSGMEKLGKISHNEGNSKYPNEVARAAKQPPLC